MNLHASIPAQSPLVVDPFQLMDDPHARFAALREDHPIIQLGAGHFMALRAADVISLLTDPRTVQIEGADYVHLTHIPDGFTSRLMSDTMLFSNDDAHRAKRSLFARSFAFARMRSAQPKIRAVADAMVARLPRGETVDISEQMAARLPALMIASILGLPESEADAFVLHANDLARAVSPVYPLADHDRIEAAAEGLYHYIEEHLRRRLARSQEDLLSAVASTWRADPMISFSSLVHQVMTIVIGGTDTTKVAFPTLVALLAQHPQQWEALRANPDLAAGAVAEGLRYEPAVASVPRFTVAPVGVGGIAVPPGVMLRVSVMSAMRDPGLYADPDVFNIERTDHPRLHTAFGLGPHRCIGEMLARLELQEALGALSTAFSSITLEEIPRMTGFGGIRQITPVRVMLR
ncbi:MAG: cytochrome P450 [Pseudorhizobium sp.]